MPSLSRQFRLPLGYTRSGNHPRVRAAQHGAQAYAQSQGLSHSVRGLSQVQAVPHTGFAIQGAYREAQGTEHPNIRASYDAMRGETNAQYEHMTRPREQGGMGIQHEVTAADPYPHIGDMAKDVKGGRIKTFSTESTGGHEFFSNTENDRFRAVHDVFGHAATGRGTTRHGEEAAWRSHVQMYSPAARQAMTSETRGQNSFLNYSPEGGFPNQGPGSKLVGLPNWAEKKRGLPPPISERQFAPQGEQGKLF